MNSYHAPLSVVVMAAGEGTRMKSQRPKPLLKLCGKSMLEHILSALEEIVLIDRVVVVVGHKEEEIRTELLARYKGNLELVFVKQESLRGTGDALAVSMTRITDPMTDLGGRRGAVMVLPADVPLIDARTLSSLVETHFSSNYAATLLTALVENPYGYGRVLRSKNGDVVSVVEERDASWEERQIREINTSLYVFDTAPLPAALRRLIPSNAQGELYLTDTVSVLANAGYAIGSLQIDDSSLVMGVNDRAQLAEAEKVMRKRINTYWMKAGVTLVDPDVTYIDRRTTLGEDVTIWPGVTLEGATTVGTGTDIGPGCRLVDCVVGEKVRLSYCEANNAYIGDGAKVGPFVNLPPGTKIAPYQEVRSTRNME